MTIRISGRTSCHRCLPPIFLLLASLLFFLAGCGQKAATTPPSPASEKPESKKTAAKTGKIPATQRPYMINGRMYYPLPSAEGYKETGTASWYGEDFHGRKTANGEIYNMHGDTSAHKTLPMNTFLLVENLDNGNQTIVRINDRGPFAKERILDLSKGSATKLGVVNNGTARVRLTALGEAVETKDDGKVTRQFLPHEDFSRGEFYVQLGAFEDLNNAERLRDKLLTAGNKTVIQAFDRGDKIFYRVQVRAGTTLAAAAEKEKIFAQSGYPDAFVIAR